MLFAALLTNDLVTGSRSQVVLWAAVISLVSVPAAFLVGLLRSRLARGGLADLFRELNTTRGATLQAALAKTLGDPGLVVAYRLPESLGYADADGRPVLVPPVAADRATARVESEGREIATLVYDASLDDDPELVDAVRAAAGIALENEHLHAEAQTRLAEVQASRERIVAAGDAERRRLERNLHDGAQQRLVALSLQLRLLQGRIATTTPPRSSSPRPRASSSPSRSRSCASWRAGSTPRCSTTGSPRRSTRSPRARRCRPPSPTTPEGRCPSRSSSPRTSSPPRRWPTSPSTRGDGGRPCASRTRTAARMIEIADDGVGGADEAGGSGLRGLADRVAALDGRLRVVSPAGAGTTVTAELPCG